MSVIEITVPTTVEMTADDSRAAMSELISDRLGISRETFLARLDAGDYEGVDDGVILHLVTLSPFAR